MEKKLKLTLGDKILVIILILISAYLAIFVFKSGMANADKYISVQIDGKEVNRYTFEEKYIGKTYDIRTGYGYNVLEIGDGYVRVIDADCPDKLDVKQGKISKPSEILVCLPHRLVIEIKAVDQGSSEIDNLSY